MRSDWPKLASISRNLDASVVFSVVWVRSLYSRTFFLNLFTYIFSNVQDVNKDLSGFDIVGRFSAISVNKDVTSCLLFCASIPFWKRGLFLKDRICSTLKENNLGANYFLLDPYPEGRQSSFDRVVSPKHISFPLNWKHFRKFKMGWFQCHCL